jgi:cob(I)alamin adenosyltransferase
MKTLFYTKKGDDGKSFIDKKKISKDDLFFEFLGTLDELNSFLGIIRALFSEEKRNIKIQKKNINEVIFELQEKIFKLQAEVAMEKFSYKKSFNGLSEEDIKYMEDLILYIDNVLPPLKNFVIPGATIFSAYFDYARALSRRAERVGVKFFKRKNKKFIFMFLNRLSSLLFALARYTNYTLDVKETHPSYK